MYSLTATCVLLLFTHLFDLVQGKSSSKVFPDDVVEAYKFAFSRPGALTAALNYYRNMLTAPKKKPNKEEEKTVKGDTLRKTQIPTLIIWVRDCQFIIGERARHYQE